MWASPTTRCSAAQVQVARLHHDRVAHRTRLLRSGTAGEHHVPVSSPRRRHRGRGRTVLEHCERHDSDTPAADSTDECRRHACEQWRHHGHLDGVVQQRGHRQLRRAALPGDWLLEFRHGSQSGGHLVRRRRSDGGGQLQLSRPGGRHRGNDESLLCDRDGDAGLRIGRGVRLQRGHRDIDERRLRQRQHWRPGQHLVDGAGQVRQRRLARRVHQLCRHPPVAVVDHDRKHDVGGVGLSDDDTLGRRSDRLAVGRRHRVATQDDC